MTVCVITQQICISEISDNYATGFCRFSHIMSIKRQLIDNHFTLRVQCLNPQCVLFATCTAMHNKVIAQNCMYNWSATICFLITYSSPGRGNLHKIKCAVRHLLASEIRDLIL